VTEKPIMEEFKIFLEIGRKKVFAGAVDWPGWCRSGRDENAAMEALLDTGSRYASVLQSTDLGFVAPEDRSAFEIFETLGGSATTDFGAPGASLPSDDETVGEKEIQRFQTVLRACWGAFDQAVIQSQGRELRKGPRGGGRDLKKILEHILSADKAYLRRIGWDYEKAEEEDVGVQLERIRREILDGLNAAARGELPKRGPRGGKRWKPRFFVRRVAWHVLDHAWEIEDRLL
jgi:hypothetical protein